MYVYVCRALKSGYCMVRWDWVPRILHRCLSKSSWSSYMLSQSSGNNTSMHATCNISDVCMYVCRFEGVVINPAVLQQEEDDAEVRCRPDRSLVT